ncbi:MAG: hypothetical protein AB8G95_28005, partial [Anaerolineae bacterium]
LKAAYVFDDQDAADFSRFMSKYRFFSQVWGHVWEKEGSAASMITQVTNHHAQQRLDYVEYRAGVWGTAEEQIGRMRTCLETLQAVSDKAFTAKYISPIPRDPTQEITIARWQAIVGLLKRYPHLAKTFVGIDFASMEEGFPPKAQRPFFETLHAFNQKNPQLKLDAVYHVGESYYDKSLESAIRWCHEASQLGVKRVGHCIALGLDPAVAIARQPQAHETELVSERLDQIDYDLHYQTQLIQYDILVNQTALLDEQAALKQRDPADFDERSYSPGRLEEVRQRQNFVLDEFVKSSMVIESCPTSNLRIGGVPEQKHHPIFNFLNSKVNVVVCADDPGIFDITLADEVDWIIDNSTWTQASLEKRLGDPRRFRLGKSREAAA